MSDDEIRAWVRMMGRTPREQAARIVDLLQHAHEDEMSSDDRSICRQQLARLEHQLHPQGLTR